MTVRYYSSTATPKTLVSSITNATTLIQVSDTAGLPATTPFTLALDYQTPVEELVDVTNVAGTMLTITRGVDGTSSTSHTAGAVVRHVSSARDFTDSRTHENSTTNVHGTAVGSAVVGTTDSQTLTNKTISGAALTGTFTGSVGGSPTFTGNPAFSGNPTFTGGPVFSGTQSFTSNTAMSGELDITNLVRGSRSTASGSQYESRVTGDANARWYMQADGKMFWGNGTNAQDLSFQRIATNAGQFNGILAVSSSDTTATSHFLVNTTAGVSPASKLLDVRAGNLPAVTTLGNGTTTFSPPTASVGAPAVRVNLPSGSTDDVLGLQNNGSNVAIFDNGGMLRTYMGNTPISYTPIISGGGSATFSTTIGWYYKIGKMVHVYAYIVASGAGSGTGTITITLPSVPFRDGTGPGTTRQFITMHGGGISGGSNSSISGSFTGLILAGGTGAMVDNVFGPTETLLRGDNIGTSTILTLEGWYRET